MQLLRQSTATTVYVGPVLDSSGAAVTTAVVGDFRLVKNGTAATLSGATVTHDANGYYTIALTTGNTDTTGRLTLAVGNMAQSMSTHRYSVLLPSVFDALITNATNTTGGLATATGSISAFAGAISTLTAPNVRTELATELGRIDAAVSSRMATYTQPAGFLAATFPATVASPTNITSASGVTLAATTHTGAVIPTVSTVTDKAGYALSSSGLSLVTAWSVNVTGNITGNVSGSIGSVTGAVGSVTSGVTVSSIGANVITATSIAASALDGKGNWNVGKTGYALTQAFPSNFAALGISVGGAVSTVVSVQNIDDGAIAPGTMDPTVYDAIRDAIWNATTASYTTAGTTGKALSDIVSRVTSTVKTMWDNLTSMITGTGASAKYTTTALSNAPSGGGGGGGDPWATDLVVGGYTGDEAGAIIRDIKAKTDLITSDAIVTSNPVAATGQISGPLYIGDDYLAANGRAFAWTFTPATGVSFSGATCRFGGGYRDVGWLVTGTLTNNGTTWTASFNLTKTETDALEPGFYDWTMEVRSSSGTEITTVAARKPVEWKAKRT